MLCPACMHPLPSSPTILFLHLFACAGRLHRQQGVGERDHLGGGKMPARERDEERQDGEQDEERRAREACEEERRAGLQEGEEEQAGVSPRLDEGAGEKEAAAEEAWAMGKEAEDEAEEGGLREAVPEAASEEATLTIRWEAGGKARQAAWTLTTTTTMASNNKALPC
jgi:hypothetical protein